MNFLIKKGEREGVNEDIRLEKRFRVSAAESGDKSVSNTTVYKKDIQTSLSFTAKDNPTQASQMESQHYFISSHAECSESGQVISFEKSAVHFSKKTKPEVVEALTQVIGVKIMSFKEKYLGSPLILGHSKKESFKSIKENFEHRFSAWSKSSLSQAGRGTMIKHVLNSVPVYQMGTFKLPNNLIQQLTFIERKFFWVYNNNMGSNSIAWVNIRKPKKVGGLAFRDLEKLNLALLTKITWRICIESSSLMSQVLGSKYFKGRELIHQNISAKNCSYTWNGITKGLNIVKDNYFMEINMAGKSKSGKIDGYLCQNMEHIIFDCKHAIAVWRGININIDVVSEDCNSVSEWVISCLSLPLQQSTVYAIDPHANRSV
ncbi:uncharacterized protein LOC113315494 [Papaver somniferum]|uniref:uncharacterized protein LOC113315494 n=1 Tax=Papaver somniferum TaxID=3469 RepID=UPI000E700D27|nr:uncharacterized protein LOC113315494 [Papaver somniferum]